MISDTRTILVAIAKELALIDAFAAKNLEYGAQIYLSPALTWFESGAPLELQVIDAGDVTTDRDGNARRATHTYDIAILLRRPAQFENKHATILTSLTEDLQSYTREVRNALDGNFLNYSDTIGVPLANLLVRPLVFWNSSRVLTNAQYPDLMIKVLTFTGGINDVLT